MVVVCGEGGAVCGVGFVFLGVRRPPRSTGCPCMTGVGCGHGGRRRGDLRVGGVTTVGGKVLI